MASADDAGDGLAERAAYWREWAPRVQIPPRSTLGNRDPSRTMPRMRHRLLAGWSEYALPTLGDESLLGYDFRQEKLLPGNDGVGPGPQHGLFARALVLRHGSQAACVVTLDHCVISVVLARRLRGIAARASGVPEGNVIVACSHTHSAPQAHDPELGADLTAALPHVDPTTASSSELRVTQRLCDATAHVAACAAGLLSPVEVAAASAPCGIAYRRRVESAGSVRLNWNPEEFPDLPATPAADPTLSVLHLRRGVSGRSAVLWNLGAHPVCLGKTSRIVSADWPGAAAAVLRDLVPGSLPLFALGACGDTHPWIATQDDPAGLAPLGHAVGGLAACLVRSAHHAAGPDTDSAMLRCAQRSITIGRTVLDLAAWRIGPATVLAAPVELFQSLAVELRQRIAGPLLLMTNANGWTGYWPAQRDFAHGGYEINAARASGREPGHGEALIDALSELAQ